MAKPLAAGRGVSVAVAAFLLPLHGASAQLVEPPTVRILVLSLFHPRTLWLQTSAPATLAADDASLPVSRDERWTLAGQGTQVRSRVAPQRGKPGRFIWHKVRLP